MQEGTKKEKILASDLDNVFNAPGYDKATTETIRLLDTFSDENRLENEKKPCDFEDSCFIAKSKMGSCPCECYR
jgi:hypothetical protein